MAIVRCGHCKQDYFSYKNSGVIPARYCSLKCWLDRRRSFGNPKALEPEAAKEVARELRAHLLEVHGEADLTAWHVDCTRCAHLDERLAAALAKAA